jgi:hypothetical protein
MNFFENSHHKSSIIPEFYNQDPNKIPKLLVERFRDG